MSGQNSLNEKQLIVLMLVREIGEYMDKNPGEIKVSMSEAVDSILEGEDTPVKGIVVMDVLEELDNGGYIKYEGDDYCISEAGMACLEAVEKSLKEKPEGKNISVPINVNINLQELIEAVTFVAGLIGRLLEKLNLV